MVPALESFSISRAKTLLQIKQAIIRKMDLFFDPQGTEHPALTGLQYSLTALPLVLHDLQLFSRSSFPKRMNLSTHSNLKCSLMLLQVFNYCYCQLT